MFRNAAREDGTLPIFVHSLQSAEAFNLAQKVWEVNVSAVRVDPANHKELEYFHFVNPSCVVWMLRDQGRSDTYEMVVIWNEAKNKITEVYTVSALSGMTIGDDSRAKDLLTAMLTTPATVPVGSSPA